MHFGREVGRHTDAFVVFNGWALSEADCNGCRPKTLAAHGMPQAATLTAVAGQAADGYSQLRNALPEQTMHLTHIDLPSNTIMTIPELL